MPYLRLSDGTEVHYRGKKAATPEAEAEMRTFVERLLRNIDTENAGGPPCCATCGGTGNGPKGEGACAVCGGTGQAPTIAEEGPIC